MLGKAYAQRPLDGTSETGPVLLRLLEDGLVGAVSIALRPSRKQKNKKTKNTLFNKGVKERGKERRKPNKEKYFVYHDGFNPSCK